MIKFIPYQPTCMQAVNIHPKMHVFGLFECHVVEIVRVFFKTIMIMLQIGEGNESYY